MISYRHKEEHLNKRKLLKGSESEGYLLTVKHAGRISEKQKTKSKTEGKQGKLPKEKHFEDQSLKA